MPISWNEVKQRAIRFADEWRGESSEISEKQTFWNEFLHIFGVNRRRVASFEHHVNKLDNCSGYIDLFWPGMLIVEHKSSGGNLDRAHSQALDYFDGIPEDNELPRYILVSDFQYFRLYDLEEGTDEQFKLAELHENVYLFGFILGFKQRAYKDEDPVNIQAASKMGELHDALEASGYAGHELEMYLVRIMFCLFADDTGIFPRDHLRYYLEERTSEDGADLGGKLSHIFQILNTPEKERQKNLDEDLQQLPHVNGTLFNENLPIPSFDGEMRSRLLDVCNFDWGKVSPAIFGSLFQSVMEPGERRTLGAHYTSEANILKAVRGLFIDDLRREFQRIQNNRNELRGLLDRIRSIHVFDPACGCGNFLVIAYRELRKLEIDIYRRLSKLKPTSQREPLLDIEHYKGINVDSMYGIEIEEFPARIAEVALWLVDHQMNILLSEELGQYFVRLPLTTSPNIKVGNAIRIDWQTFFPYSQNAYIIGNPPYAGKKRRTEEQKQDMTLAFGNRSSVGKLDYVACWFILAADVIAKRDVSVAFVATNSISQGEQVGILWEILFEKDISIDFAHRTFRWSNKGRGMASVFVVIIGFSHTSSRLKYLYHYEKPDATPTEVKAKNINPYLVDQDNIIIKSRRTPIDDAPPASFGSMPNDDGNLLLSEQERDLLLRKAQTRGFHIDHLIKPLIKAGEFLNGDRSWCLWLVNAQPQTIRRFPELRNRVEAVRQYRQNSKRQQTKAKAQYASMFAEIRQPDIQYILIPRHSSEHREYIPMSFLPAEFIAHDSCLVVPKATWHHFGVLMSAMHMAWVRQICGRIKGDYRYSSELVYNNFPWPKDANIRNIRKVSKCARDLVRTRQLYPDSALADLYDPVAMPSELRTAHSELDKAVDLCYRPQPFPNEHNRLKFLFDLYKRRTNPLFER